MSSPPIIQTQINLGRKLGKPAESPVRSADSNFEKEYDRAHLKKAKESNKLEDNRSLAREAVDVNLKPGAKSLDEIKATETREDADAATVELSDPQDSSLNAETSSFASESSKKPDSIAETDNFSPELTTPSGKPPEGHDSMMPFDPPEDVNLPVSADPHPSMPLPSSADPSLHPVAPPQYRSRDGGALNENDLNNNPNAPRLGDSTKVESILSKEQILTAPEENGRVNQLPRTVQGKTFGITENSQRVISAEHSIDSTGRNALQRSGLPAQSLASDHRAGIDEKAVDTGKRQDSFPGDLALMTAKTATEYVGIRFTAGEQSTLASQFDFDKTDSFDSKLQKLRGAGNSDLGSEDTYFLAKESAGNQLRNRSLFGGIAPSDMAAKQMLDGGLQDTLGEGETERFESLASKEPSLRSEFPTHMSTQRPGDTITFRAHIAKFPVAQTAELLARSTGQAVEISLSPSELGRVKMSLTMSESGLVLLINAERVETLDLMKRHVEQLTQEFKKQGFENVGFSFEQGGRDETSRVPMPPSSRNLAEEEPAPISDLPQKPMLGGLDIRI